MASSSITVPGTSTYLRCRPTDIPMRRRFGAAVVGLLLAACSSIGPATVPHDRIDYGSSIGNSWKEQTLLNIVKLRYGDIPIFLEVAQVIAGYQLQGTLGTGFTAGNFNAAVIGPQLRSSGAARSRSGRAGGGRFSV